MLHIDPVERVAAYIKDDYKLLVGDQDSSASCDSSEFYPLNVTSVNFDIIQLFNIMDDPSEETDLWGDYPEIAKNMTEELKSYLSHQEPIQCQLDRAHPHCVVTIVCDNCIKSVYALTIVCDNCIKCG